MRERGEAAQTKSKREDDNKNTPPLPPLSRPHLNVGELLRGKVHDDPLVVVQVAVVFGAETARLDADAEREGGF